MAALGIRKNMDFNTFKNIAFASFTFAPVLLLALMLMVVALTCSLFNNKKTDYVKILKLSFRAMLYQFLFLFVVGVIFGVLFLVQFVKFIPLILILPLSTIISFVVFLKLYWRARNEIHT